MIPFAAIVRGALAAGSAVVGFARGVRDALRPPPPIDETLAQMQRDRAEQYARLKRNAGIADPLPDEKTPAERPSRLPEGP